MRLEGEKRFPKILRRRTYSSGKAPHPAAQPTSNIESDIATRDLELTVPIPHDYFRSYSVQSSVNADCKARSKKLTEFRGYVVSKGFDIENVLSDILTHLLFLNRPKYDNETEDEYIFHSYCRGFIRDGLLGDPNFGFRKKIRLLNDILAWIPQRLKDVMKIPDKLLNKASDWRNKFAHAPIGFTLSKDNRVRPLLEARKKNRPDKIHLTKKMEKEISDVMEVCYDACVELANQLCVRFGDARPNGSHGSVKGGAALTDPAAPSLP